MAQYGGSPPDPGSMPGTFIGSPYSAPNGGASGISEIKDKEISYNSANSEEILNISSVSTVATTKEAMPSRVEVENTGGVPISIMAGYQEWSSDTAVSGNTEYLHIMLMPGEIYVPPVRAVIRTGETSVIMDGTVVSNTAPDSNEYVDSTANVDSATASGIVSSNSSTALYLEPYTSAANCTANLFFKGDLVRIRDEVMEVTAIGSKADLANNVLTVKRGVHGSTAVTAGADGDPVWVPFFNAYHDYDKYSVAQTDSDGKFKCTNFFGLGRAATGVQGLIPGSIAIKFYEAGYQSFGLSGITASTNTGLNVSTAYAFDIQVDGGTNFDNLTFTTDSSNVNFGGTSGVISKIQDALDTQYYTAGNLFEKRVHVGIVDGDLRFTSGSRLSTSAIAITAEDGADASFLGTGRIPAVGNINAAVAARLPDDTFFDKVTYLESPNTGVFAYDDGSGNLFGMCGRGSTINYETGAIDMIGCPANAEFVYSVSHTSAFSGKLNDATTSRVNSLVNVLANTPSTKWNGKVQTRLYAKI